MRMNLSSYTASAAFLLIILFTTGAASANECTQVSVTCIDTSPVVVNGVTIPGVCKERAIFSDCATTNPIDSCTQFESEANCTRRSNRCIQEEGSTCVERRQEWDCVNAAPTFPPAQLLQRRARNVEEELVGDCAPLNEDQNCSRVSSTCTQPSETRDINHIPIARDCWGWERTYHCRIGEAVDTCTEYAGDPSVSGKLSGSLILYN